MRRLRCWLKRFWGLFDKKQRDGELASELESHLQMHIEDNVRAGMSSDEARRQALLKLGGVEQSKENYRDRRGLPWIEILLQDVRFGLRMLRKNPGFTAVAILTLALGIGANTAIFSVVQGVLLAPLPYRESGRLVEVWQSNVFPRVAISYPNFLDWQRTARSFEQMAAFAGQGYDLASPGTSEHFDGEEISAGFFSTLGVKPVLGREFSPKEDVHGGAPVVIISDRLWRDRFGGNPAALGKAVTLSGVNYAVVGVLPPEFRFWADADIYTPLGQGDPLVLDPRAGHWISCIARLKPGMSMSRAQAEMSTIQNDLDQDYPEADRDLGAVVVNLKEQILGKTGGSLLFLLGAAGLVLLIACANVANLLLARSSVRRRELAVRAALGASRARVIRQLLTESVLLALAGGALGLAVAAWGVSPVLAAAPGSVPRTQNIGVNVSVLLFAFGVSMAVGILFGLAPALMSSRFDLQASLKEGGRGLASGHHRAQNTLVIVEMGLTLVLLAGSGLLLRTIRHLWDVNPGFDPQHIIAFRVGMPPSLTKTAASTRTAYQQLIERIRKIPGVQAADFTDVVPLTRQGGTMPFWIGSQKPASLQEAPRLVGFLTGPDYLRTMGIPLLRGRFFTMEDTTKSPCVVVIDSVFTDMYFQGRDPLGQTLTFGFTPTPPCRIVGVVGHVRDSGLSDLATNIRNQVYFPLYQDPDQWVADNYSYLTVMVRTPLDITIVMPAIKTAVYGTGGDQPVYDVRTMQETAAASMSSQRFPMILLGAFAALALLLAAVGIYGVVSYSVTQRVHEIGIRMALGAERKDVFRMIIGQGLRLTFGGVVIGAVAALILTRLLSSFSNLLYGVGASDPVTFVAVATLLTTVALAACYVPARRATRVDPMVALRYE